MKRIIFMAFNLFIFLIFATKENDYNQQKSALIDLYNSLDGENWYPCNWKENIIKNESLICDWCQVICSENSSNILSLDLNKNNLSGELNSTISSLPYLNLLDLSNNKIRLKI